jgi:hypothetical protein
MTNSNSLGAITLVVSRVTTDIENTTSNAAQIAMFRFLPASSLCAAA